jgi:hypothetical protein
MPPAEPMPEPVDLDGADLDGAGTEGANTDGAETAEKGDN